MGVNKWLAGDEITADKLNNQGNLRTTDIFWTTVFESIDGFNTIGSTVNLGESRLELLESDDTYGQAVVRKKPEIGSFLSWDKDREFQCIVKVSTISLVRVDFMLGLGGAYADVYTGRHVGFKIASGVLYGSVADGTTESTLNCGAVSGGVVYKLRVKYTAGSKAEFYVNDVLKGEITTNLPTGSTSAERILEAILQSTETGNKYKVLTLYYWSFWQDED